jgi:hypothetical protein
MWLALQAVWISLRKNAAEKANEFYFKGSDLRIHCHSSKKGHP